MITGYYPGTARNIARQIGLAPNDDCITGPELDAMSEKELRRRISEVNIFARVVPEQKLRLVEVLKANGEIVAMTGDGGNDAPALKSPNPALWWVIGGTLLFLGLVLCIPLLRNLFKFDRLHSFDLWLCLAAGTVSILWFEGLKFFHGLRTKKMIS